MYKEPTTEKQAICVSCGETTPYTPPNCSVCGQNPLLGDAYRLDEVIGRGGAGVTYRAVRLTDNTMVCVKELAFNRLTCFEAEKYFQREAKVLRQLHHRAIPAYIDSLIQGTGKALSLYLVQEYVVGDNLEVESISRRYKESEVLHILLELLVILEYLHNLAPPVIHRDIKPSNVLRRRDNGSLVLIDFGAVKDAVDNSGVGGSTIAGTFGYMAPEQYRGVATASSDLYSVGVFAVTLLSRRKPSTMLGYDNQLNWKRYVKVHEKTKQLLAQLLLLDPKRRPQSARQASELVRIAIDALEAECQEAEFGEVISSRVLRTEKRKDAGKVNLAPNRTALRPIGPTPQKKISARLSDNVDFKSALFAGIVCFATFGILGLVYNVKQEKSAESNVVATQELAAAHQQQPDAEASSAEQNVEKQWKLLSTPMLQNLGFGMTTEEVKLQLPIEMVPNPPFKRWMTPFLPDCEGSVLAHVETNLHEHPVTCCLVFGSPKRGLSKIQCMSSREHELARKRWFEGIRHEYGPPTVHDDRTVKWQKPDGPALMVSRLQNQFGLTTIPPIISHDSGMGRLRSRLTTTTGHSQSVEDKFRPEMSFH